LPRENSPPPRALLLFFSYLFPLLLSLSIVVSVLQNERIVGMSWEFAEYGSIARNINRGAGAVSGAFEPYDLALLKKVDPRPTPPIAIHNRTLLPIWLTAASIRLFGEGDVQVMLPHILALLALVFLTNHLERRLVPGTHLPFAAVLVAATPVVFLSAIQCYPNVLFATLFLSFLWLVFRVSRASNGEEKGRRATILEYIALGLLSGLTQLARSDFAICLPFILIYFWIRGGSRAALRNSAIVLSGWLLFNVLEWSYALHHYGTVLRSETFWTNLANVKYGTTWLYYVELDRIGLLTEHWSTFARKVLVGGPRLAIKVGMMPVRHFGLGAGALALAIAALGLLRATQFARAAGHLKTLLVLGCVGLSYVLLFALLRGNVRYFVWTLPLIGILLRFGVEDLSDTLGGWMSWRRVRRRMVTEGAVLVALIPICASIPMRASAGELRHYVKAPTPYYAPTESDGVMRRIMESSLADNYPTIRQTVPADAVIMTNEPAMHWYTDRLAMYLPMDLESIAAIERDWFPLRYLYLGPTLWRERDQPIDARYRHYLEASDGTIPESFDGKLVALLQHLESYTPIRLFDNGGVLFARRGETPQIEHQLPGGEEPLDD
jgi:hypothetical protein